MLNREETFDNIVDLAAFWNDVALQNVDRFSDRVLRKLFVLNYAPNGMWTYIVSVYYIANRNEDGTLDDEKFYRFLDKIIAFIWTYAVTNPGVNALRTPIYAEMVNIVNGLPVEFKGFHFEPHSVENALNNYVFSNNRAITKSMLTWWAFHDDNQPLLSLERVFEIEHIYPRNRQENERSLSNTRNLEALGNKSLLEPRINIRASDYRFSDRVKYYKGFENAHKQWKEGTQIRELLDLAETATDFTEDDIVRRTKKIFHEFIQYIEANRLLQE